MRILIFSTTFVWLIYHSKKNSAGYCHKCRNVFRYSTRQSCQILRKFELSRKKKLKISSFIKIRPVEAELFHADTQDTRDKAKGRFSQFCERT
jgi:hypothetical protein